MAKRPDPVTLLHVKSARRLARNKLPEPFTLLNLPLVSSTPSAMHCTTSTIHPGNQGKRVTCKQEVDVSKIGLLLILGNLVHIDGAAVQMKRYKTVSIDAPVAALKPARKVVITTVGIGDS